jgi:glucose-1-phosphate cytidylyltransferase
MQVLILAGGYGTRISEESATRPKPMVEIGGRPILWHIMKIYLAHGLTDFVICCGYKGQMIKQFFRDYALDGADVRFDMGNNTTELLRTSTEPWKVTLVDTGLESMTGGRIKRAAPYLADGPFCCTYGDGVSDVDITRLIAFHREQGALATVTAVQPPGRFGAFSLQADSTRVPSFREKFFCARPQGDRADRRRRHRMGARADGTTGCVPATRCVSPRGLLAADGHAARQAPSRIALGIGQSALEELVARG